MKNIFSLKLSTSAEATELKKEFLNLLEGNKDIYACPESLTPVQKVRKYYGLIEECYYYNKEFGKKYPILPGYVDFTIKGEIDKPFWTLSIKEQIGQNFFQTPVNVECVVLRVLLLYTLINIPLT